MLIIFTVFITSCSGGAGSVKTYHNDEIDKESLDSVKILDDKILESIKNNNADNILEISSESFEENSKNIKEIISSINQSVNVKSFDYKDRYYCKVNKVGKYSFAIGTLQDESFNIKLNAVSKDIFVSLIKSNSNSIDYILSLVYIKEQGEWKLMTLNCGEYSYYGMNAIDLYEKAKSLDTKGYKVPAGFYIRLYGKLLHPVPILQYKKESEITDYSKRFIDSTKNDYTFPKKLENTDNVELYGFDVKYVKDELIPVVKYTTNMELSNKEAIEKEANEINNEVTSQYPGMKENFKLFLYEAYSEPPIDPKKTYNCYRTGVEQ